MEDRDFVAELRRWVDSGADRSHRGMKVGSLALAPLALTLLTACGPNTVAPASTNMSTTTPAATTTNAAPPTSRAILTKKWVDLDVGDCLVDPPPTDPSVVTVAVADCAVPHQAEVYSRVLLEVNSALADVANRDCAEGFSQYTGRSIDGSPFTVTFLIDSDQDRTSNNPHPSAVICILQTADVQPVTGSARR